MSINQISTLTEKIATFSANGPYITEFRDSHHSWHCQPCEGWRLGSLTLYTETTGNYSFCIWDVAAADSACWCPVTTGKWVGQNGLASPLEAYSFRINLCFRSEYRARAARSVEKPDDREAGWNSSSVLRSSARGKGVREAECLRPRLKRAVHRHCLCVLARFYPVGMFVISLAPAHPSLPTIPTLPTPSHPLLCPNLIGLLDIRVRRAAIKTSQSLCKPGPPQRQKDQIRSALLQQASAHFKKERKTNKCPESSDPVTSG